MSMVVFLSCHCHGCHFCSAGGDVPSARLGTKSQRTGAPAYSATPQPTRKLEFPANPGDRSRPASIGDGSATTPLPLGIPQLSTRPTPLQPRPRAVRALLADGRHGRPCTKDLARALGCTATMWQRHAQVSPMSGPPSLPSTRRELQAHVVRDSSHLHLAHHAGF